MNARSDDDQRFATRTETAPVEVPHQRDPQAGDNLPVAAEAARTAPAARRDQVSWGAVWAGTLVALPTYLVLEFLFFAFGWLDLAYDGGAAPVARGVVSAVLGMIAFFVGGLLAGASSAWRAPRNGLVNGVLVWALGVVGIVVMALAGGTSLLGPLGDTAVQPQAPDITDVAVAAARQTAGWAALILGVYWAAAALGGAAGSRIWPRGRSAHERS
jgi:cation transport ATPase